MSAQGGLTLSTLQKGLELSGDSGVSVLNASDCEAWGQVLLEAAGMWLQEEKE